MLEKEFTTERLIPVGNETVEFDESQGGIQFVIDGYPNQVSEEWIKIQKKLQSQEHSMDEDVKMFMKRRNYKGEAIFCKILDMELSKFHFSGETSTGTHCFQIKGCCVERDYCCLERSPRVYSPQNHYMLAFKIDENFFIIPKGLAELELAMFFRSVILTGAYGACPGCTEDVLITVPSFDWIHHPMIADPRFDYKLRLIEHYVKRERLLKTEASLPFAEDTSTLLKRRESLIKDGLLVLTYIDVAYLIEKIIDPSEESYKLLYSIFAEEEDNEEDDSNIVDDIQAIMHTHWFYSKMTENPPRKKDPTIEERFNMIFKKYIKKAKNEDQNLIIEKINKED